MLLVEAAQAKKLLALEGNNIKPSEAYSIIQEKLHTKILLETGANMFSQYWDILNQATEAGWPVVDKVKEKNGHLSADEFSVNAALGWMKEKGIELKPVPKIPHNPGWYLKEK